MRDASVPLAALFLIGVACGVYVIVRGVERPGAARHHPRVDAFGREVAMGKISLKASVIAAACTTVGFVGYLGVRVFAISATISVVIGLGVAMVTVPLAVRMVRAWAVRAAAEDPVDPRYALQGHVAHVVRAAAGEERAVVEYTANGQRVVAPAECVDQSPLAAGSDVVIDRLDAGVVYVEPWSRVEQRL